MDDGTIFWDYRATRSEHAFAALVASQIDLAYSVALRSVRDVHLAQDVTQAVFIILAEKAAMLPPTTNISGWIFRTTQYVAKNALRAAARRRAFEREYAQLNSPSLHSLVPATSEAVDRLAAVDLGLAQLGKKDQEAVLLKYYCGKSWQEVGAALGLTEEAARKRIGRALRRLRDLLPVSVAAVALAEWLPSHAVGAAPPHLAGMVLQNMALPAGAAAGHTSACALAKGSLMAMTKLKVAGVAAMVALVAAPASWEIAHLAAPSVRSARPSPAALVVSVSAGMAVAQSLPFTMGKETTRITGPLHADGTVDYVAALNERYKKEITPEKNGFVDWLQVVGTQAAVGTDNPTMMWPGSNGGMWVPTPSSKEGFLKFCEVEPTPPGAELWKSRAVYTRERGIKPSELTRNTAARQKLWTPEEYPELADYLTYAEPFLTRAVAAAEKPQWWIPAVSNDGWTMDAVLWPAMSWPSTGTLETMGDDLCARATLCAKLGDFAGFRRDVLAVKRMARHVAAGPAWIERMTGASLDRMASEAIAAAAGSGTMTAAQWRQLAKDLDGLEPLPGLADSVDVQSRWSHLDMAAMIATGKYTEFSEQIDVRLARIDPTAVDWNAVMKDINGNYDAIFKALEEKNLRKMQIALEPIGRRLTRAKAAALANEAGLKQAPDESRQAYTQRVAEGILASWSIIPVLASLEGKQRATSLEGDMARTLVAANQYHAEKGKWPDKLEDLTPEYMRAVPKDIFSRDGAAEINFIVDHQGPEVYSVGPNGVDDAGMNNPDTGTDDIRVGGN